MVKATGFTVFCILPMTGSSSARLALRKRLAQPKRLEAGLSFYIDDYFCYCFLTEPLRFGDKVLST